MLAFSLSDKKGFEESYYSLPAFVTKTACELWSDFHYSVSDNVNEDACQKWQQTINCVCQNLHLSYCLLAS